jgi:hypothetical protein
MVDPGLPRAGMVLSVEAFEAAKPDDVELYHCRPDRRPPDDLDAFILHGDLFDRRWIEPISGKPVMAHRHGAWHAGDPIFRRWILDNASLVTFNSPKQRELFRYPVNAPEAFVPLPVDVAKFQAAAGASKDRQGTIFLGLIVPAKGVAYTLDWALQNGGVDFWGEAPFPQVLKDITAPSRYCGSVGFEQVPELLARYKQFIFTPPDGDLYARVVMEAKAAGCELILRGDIDAFAIWECLDACQVGAQAFWQKARSVTDAM